MPLLRRLATLGRGWFVPCGLAIFACGGRTEDETAVSPTDAGTDRVVLVDGHAPPDALPVKDAGSRDCAPGGVRLCGGDCDTGGGCAECTDLVRGDGSDAGYGVCWSDLTDFGNTPCALCDENSVCVQRTKGTYVCVPLAVCDALVAFGVRDSCWYGDKVPFDGRPLASATSCPSDPKMLDIVCGGSCPQCSPYTLDRCVGRGPDHAFGVCPALYSSADRTDVSSFPVCSLSATGGMAVPCPAMSNYPYSCAVSPYPPGAANVARLNGYCLSTDLCTWLAQSLPGGMWCYDASGKRVAP